MKEITELYKSDRKKFVNIMSRILRGDYAGGEDIVQEAFTRAWQFQHSFDPKKGTLRVWFNKILFNALRDWQNQKRGQPTFTGEDFSAADVLPVHSFSRSPEFSKLIRQRIATHKNQKHRSVLELFFILGYTSTEISQIEEKVSVSNVTTIVSRFRDQLTEELKWR